MVNYFILRKNLVKLKKIKISNKRVLKDSISKFLVSKKNKVIKDKNQFKDLIKNNKRLKILLLENYQN